MKNPSSDGLLEKAKAYAFLLLKFRLRSEQEIRGRMKQKKYPPEVIGATIEFLQKKKFLDDAAFTRAWMDSRLKRSLGLRRVKNELKLKGVNASVIEQSVAAVKDDYSEDGVVADLIRRKLQTMKALDARK
ncbi:MAG: regulatory protein RecX [Candidatus Omnitrophota bacterium]